MSGSWLGWMGSGLEVNRERGVLGLAWLDGLAGQWGCICSNLGPRILLCVLAFLLNRHVLAFFA